MKTTLLLFAVLFAPLLVSAQAPQSMTYQSVVRDGSNNLVANAAVGLQISILQGSPTGTASYVETHSPTTNTNGLATVEIGNGTIVSGTFSTIDWSNGPYYLKSETDPSGGTNYTITGTTQLLSVPYALYSEEAANTFSGDYNDLTNAPTNVSSFANDAGYITSPDDADADPTNEIQTLSLNGVDLTISGGNTVTIPTGGTDDQTLSFSGTTLSIEDGNSVDLFSLQDGVNDADADPSNELQTLSQVGSTVTLSNAGGSISVDDNDSNPTNEIQTLSQAGSTVTLSGGGGSINIDDNDSDPTNEFQDLSLSGNTLSLTNDATTVDLSGYLDNTDAQTLSISGNDLTISNGNTVTLPSGGGGANTLDQAYDEGGAGLGRVIAADAGAVEVNASVANSVGFDANHSNTGVAIRGRSTSTTTPFSTGQFESVSTSGTNLAPVAGLAGVYTGSGAFGTGLAGQNLLTTPGVDAHGVYGLASNNSSGGLYGRNTIGFGAVGTGLYGVFGEAENLNGGGVVGQLAASLGATQAGYLGAYRNTFEYAVFADNDILFEGFLDGASGGVYRISGDAATGNFSITGNIAKGGGTFKIDHPLDPENKYLYHSFVESPDMMNIYNGIAEFDDNGFVVVTMPDYFEALNTDFRYQLTAMGASMPGLYVAEEIDGNTFKIGGGVAGAKVSWQVTGVRQDNYANANRVVPEVEKEDYNKGRYLHPTLFGASEDQGVHLRDPNAKSEKQDGYLDLINPNKPEGVNLKLD